VSDRVATGHADRAVAPVAGALLLVVTVGLVGVVAGVTAGLPADVLADPAPAAALSASAEGDRVTLVHRGGDALDVGALRLVVRVDGEALARQPPVPFFSAPGFRSGPTGPFNAASDDRWTAGERASFRVAETNRPVPAPGDRIEVRVYADGARIATLEATVGATGERSRTGAPRGVG